MNTDDLIQFHVCYDHPDYPGMFCVRRVPMNSIGRTIAVHKNRDAVLVTIPTTHIRAEVPVIAPIVEVWIDKRIDAGGVQRMPL